MILHADMDAFYASIEQRDDPTLRGRPVVVGGGASRGVVAAASYEARPYGIRSAMPTAQALRRCPELVLLPPRMSHYVEISQQIRAILGSFSPLVEPLSLDEAFVELSGTEALHGPAAQVAHRIKSRVRDELQLVVSVGVGPTKFIAKIASDIDKPDGLVIVGPDEVESFLHPLAVSRLWGVGKVAQGQLQALGIETIGDLARYPHESLVSRFGRHGEHLWQLAHGIDPRAVEVEHVAKSIGHEDTFANDLDDLQALGQIVREQADQVARRLRHHQLWAQTVVLKLKSGDFKLRTRQRRLPRPTSDGVQIGRVACELLAKLQPKLGPVRLSGVSAADLTEQPPQQLSFDEPRLQQRDELGHVLDQICEKFGHEALVRGRAPTEPTRPRDQPRRQDEPDNQT